MRCIMLSFVTCLALSHFLTLPHIRHDFQEKKITECKICVLIFSTDLSEKLIILRRTERDMKKNVYRSSCKVLVILVRF